MLHFNKLRLSGFKSFVDPSDLMIDLGLTGIVGPNGCGKSNLVEALKWVMGETSAKQMRGGGMEDVIFAGTAQRPQRNVAEVLLTLDNNDRTAPPQFNEAEQLDILRRIERDKGSLYKINGKEVRARDVQLLFADQATGARSTALVSQGKIGAVISAKPTDRRMLLEEAAGITGLHSRRHEAELRLRAADGNLERLDDILQTLDAQMQGLKKQARQATRYRNLSELIRKAEAAMYFLRWTQAEEAMNAARIKLSEAEREVARLTGLTSEASTAQAAAAEGLPELRQSEAAAAAELQRLTIARDGLDEEERRVEAQQKDTEERLAQTAADLEREGALASDAEAAIRRLGQERETIEAERAGEAERREEAEQALEAANAQVSELDGRLTALRQQIAETDAQRASLENRVHEMGRRRERLSARSAEIEDRRRALVAEMPEAAALDDAERAFAEAAEALEARRAQADEAESRRDLAREAQEAARTKHQTADGERTRLEAEEQALARILENHDPEMWPPMLDTLGVAPGFETALAAALGEDLDASSDEAAPQHWKTLSPLTAAPALPEGAKPLSEIVQAPAALARRLSQIGVVEDQASGVRLMPHLHQGQRLVSRDGGLWRWDGFTVGAGAPTPAAVRLEQRNRLADVRRELEGALATAAASAREVEAAKTALEQATEAAKQARAEAQTAERTHNEARNTAQALKEKMAAQDSKLQALADQAEGVASDLAETETALADSKRELDELPDTAASKEQAEELRGELEEKRSHQVACRSHRDNLDRLARERARRLDDMAQEGETWTQRLETARSKQTELSERREALTAERQRLAGLPAELQEKRHRLQDSIDESEKKRNAEADRLAQAEDSLRQADRSLREAEAELSSAREERVRQEGALEQSKQSCHDIAERVRERLDCRPDQLWDIAELNAEKGLPELADTERKAERLNRERETMGPVNLRAEQEMRELDEQIETLNTEREDLTQAIEKLRKGINELNREGRERLLASFHEVDKHFQELFQRLFGGGHAHLELTEADDPLEAGLEIMASPPGKKLQALSLLSGGEQALTALSLLFAVFMTNPAPICVLDEVDAPLDDANVDRFCTMLEEMSHSQKTRFLVITHHRMTMARMDRLYGVTMTERGISQLVSVDLERAEALRETA